MCVKRRLQGDINHNVILNITNSHGELVGSGDMVQCLRVPAALVKVPSRVPTPPSGALELPVTLAPEGSVPSSEYVLEIKRLL